MYQREGTIGAKLAHSISKNEGSETEGQGQGMSSEEDGGQIVGSAAHREEAGILSTKRSCWEVLKLSADMRVLCLLYGNEVAGRGGQAVPEKVQHCRRPAARGRDLASGAISKSQRQLWIYDL